jgi:hypothetical protein
MPKRIIRLHLPLKYRIKFSIQKRYLASLVATKVNKIKRTWTTKGSDGKVYATDTATGWDENTWNNPLIKQAAVCKQKGKGNDAL